jgi:hypothetical protein
MDVNVSYAVTVGLRLRGVDVLTAQEDLSSGLKDSELLTRSGSLGCILFTQDDDLLREAAQRQDAGKSFAGLIYAHQLNVTIGQCVNDLELISRLTDLKEWTDRVGFLPLT